MVVGSSTGMLTAPDDSVHGPNGDLESSLQSELDLILQAHRSQRINNRARDLDIYRSGSAPPTVEGSLSAVCSLFRNSNFSVNGVGNTSRNDVVLSEEEIRSHPAYLFYYYSNDNINPRLPLPLISREDWRVAQRFQDGGSSLEGTGDSWKKKCVNDGESSSLFSMQPGHFVQKMKNDLIESRNANRNITSRQSSAECLNRGMDGLAGLQGARLGARRKSFADILQEGTSFSGHISRPASHNSFGDIVDTNGRSGSHLAVLHDRAEKSESLQSRAAAAPPGFVEVQGNTISFATDAGSSLSRSTTPEQQQVGRAAGSSFPPVGFIEKKNGAATLQNGPSSGMTEIAATLTGLSMSKVMHADQNSCTQRQVQTDLANQRDFLLNMSNNHNQSLPWQLVEKSNAEYLSSPINYIEVQQKNEVIPRVNASKTSSNGEIMIPKRTLSSSNRHSKDNSSGFVSLDISSVGSMGLITPSAYSANQKLHTVIENQIDSAPGLGSSVIGGGQNKLGHQVGADFLSSALDLRYAQYLQKSSDYAAGAVTASNGHRVRNYVGTSNVDLDGIQKAYFESLLAQQKQQYEPTFLGKSRSLDQKYYRNPSYDLHMPYPRNLRATCILSSLGSEISQNELVGRFNSMMRSSMGGSVGSGESAIGNNVEKKCASSLLDDFKKSKTRSFEISDILHHVVEFSTDQYGSRFIQQKLETATVEEKDKIFPEIIPHARTLMTDVFGNYVIQKLFERGTESQRMELVSQLTGHVLLLSLQMYGCRVIQKALEVVDIDQQTQMVAELSGSVMKCVRDQNGNHVIQKCIECVPEDRIQFIISAFYGQVMALSTHTYGCRVIQRVLEYCEDAKTRQIIMDEIMQSVCSLAQDQYGNYVIQHILEHGKPQERSAIISKLAGQIVKMSQQKFASNVVEKCLTFGSPEERQLLVTEILGSTDENEPLQVMMKDPFGNYVVQKVLESCDDRSLELILSRIKVHLNALKRYTYGKHIVSRVEKLITTGERRIGLSSSFSSQ